MWRIHCLIGILSFPVSQCLLVSSFLPCPPPRFDSFEEQIVGDWWQQETDRDATKQAFTVDEVMRSCGGAVQGIREISWQNYGGMQGQYLNRADDGFLQQNDGSYTWGPTELSQDAVDIFMSSFTLEKGLRILFTGMSSEPILLCRRRNEELIPKVVVPFSSLRSEIQWTRHARCRMPSSSLTWMSQRLRWEEATTEAEIQTNAVAKGDDKVDYAFETKCSAKQLQDNWNIASSCWVHNGELGPRIILSVAGLRHKIRAVCREYAPDGSLVSVLWSEGFYRRLPLSD